MTNVRATLLVLLGLGLAGAGCSEDDGPPSGGGSGGQSSGGTSGVGPTGGGGGSGSGSGGSSGEAPGDFELDADAPLDATPPAFDARSHPLAPTALWGELSMPLPTNAWFMNLVLGSGEQRVNVFPYQIKALSQGVSVAEGALSVSENSVVTADVTDLRIGIAGNFEGHALTRYDALGVELRYTNAVGSMRVPLVRGMPYVTAIYQNQTAQLTPGSGTITAVDGIAPPGVVNGKRFVLSLSNGQRWVVYTSLDTVFVSDSSRFYSASAFSGVLRVARLESDAELTLLDAHAEAVPLGGSFSMRIKSGTGELGLRFDVEPESARDKLLMFVLPHHEARLDGATWATLSRRSLRGSMRALIGAELTIDYPLVQVGFSALRPVPDESREAVLSALVEDEDYTPQALDPYFGGKHLAKLARLVLIAEELGDETRAEAFRARLESLVSAWLDGTNEQKLVYDTTWGGVVSRAGLLNPAADFGQGYYNDHHFHYGYLLYAAAVLARDEAWARRYRSKILWLARDIANPSSKDPSFPVLRHMDLWEGHSWASGLFEFADGRNQESTSEAVNAYYALELLGSALDEPQLAGLGRMLRAIEVDGAQAYHQVKDDSPIYDAPFRNRHVVGVLWSTKVDFGTFFSADPAAIFGIQLLPFTPVSELLLDPVWIEDAASDLAAAAKATESEGFAGFLHMARAIVSPQAAADIGELESFDDGNSRANTLYWLATRP